MRCKDGVKMIQFLTQFSRSSGKGSTMLQTCPTRSVEQQRVSDDDFEARYFFFRWYTPMISRAPHTRNKDFILNADSGFPSMSPMTSTLLNRSATVSHPTSARSDVKRMRHPEGKRKFFLCISVGSCETSGTSWLILLLASLCRRVDFKRETYNVL